MKCPNCQTDNKENTRYCNKCGLDLIIYKDGVKKESIEKSKTYGQYSDAQDYLMDGSKATSKENSPKAEKIADSQDEDQKKISESQSKEESSKSDKHLVEKDKSTTINSNKSDSQNVLEKKEKTDKNEKFEKKLSQGKKMTGAAFEISSKDRGLRLAAFVLNLITTILTGILLIPLC